MNYINKEVDSVFLKQATLKTPINFSGVGVHNGRCVNMTIYPAKEDSGIIFKRLDLNNNNIIKAHINSIDRSYLCTRLTNKKGASVSTIEHLMAAFSAFGIDNALVELNDAELPALDGSSGEYIKKFIKYGIEEQKKNKKVVRILKNIEVSDSKRFVSISPSEDFSLNITIDYPNTLIGRSSLTYIHSKQNFVDYLSHARTYALYEDIEKMRASGQGIGGNLNNAIVVDKYKILNSDGLRFEKEFVKHKALDCIGDLYLLGMPLLGSIECFAPGHQLNHKLVHKILEDQNNYVIEDAYTNQSYNTYVNIFNENSLSTNFTNVA